MRPEHDMLALIVATAKRDERIRAVIMNGSRANPHTRRDIFQDFDITYLVTDVAPFRDDAEWIRRFGEIMILQTPEAMEDPPPTNDGHFAYLMQFTDGNRIDLTLFPVARLMEFERDSLSVLLLDKDGLIAPFPPPCETDYLPKPPTAKLFSDCCNEFWWVCTYVAKGLWRDELIYSKHMLEQVLREQMMKMLVWHMAVRTGFLRSPGYGRRHLKHYLEPDLWRMLERTYSDASSAGTWDALEVMCDLFRLVATNVAEHFGFEYPRPDDARVRAHLKHVRQLPRDAEAMY